MPFTAVTTLADEPDGTRYLVTVMHPDEETQTTHEEMGFSEGWGICIDQLEAIARET